MVPANKTPPAPPPDAPRTVGGSDPGRELAPYEESSDEGSSVRRKPSLPPRDEWGATERVARLDLKIGFAKIVLDELDPKAERALLIRIAIVRRDETLLDELLGIGSPPHLED